MLSLSLVFSCFTLTAAASDEAVSELEGLEIVGSDDVICSIPVDDGISAYADVGYKYKSASIQYRTAYATGNTAFTYPSAVTSQGFANSSSALNNGIMGYTTFPNLASSAGVTMKALTGHFFIAFLAYVFSSGAVSQINPGGGVASNSYFDYLASRKLIDNDFSTPMSSVTKYKACATVIDTVYMAMDITVPAKSAFDVSSFNWEFDVGTSAAGNYYSVLSGSRFIAFNCNVYVDGKAVYEGRSFGLGNPDYTLRSGYICLSNGSLSQLLGNQSYYLTNNDSKAKTFTVGVELVPAVQHENMKDIAYVEGYGNTATSWGAPVICYFGSNTQTPKTWANLFKYSPTAIHHTSSNAPSSAARVDSQTAAALSKLSNNGYYYYVYLSSKSTEDRADESSQKIIELLGSIINNQNTLKTTSSSILTKVGTMVTNQTSMINNQKTMITNQNNIYNTEKQILATDKSILSTNQSIANALLTNPYVVEFFDSRTGQTTATTQQGLDDALIAQGNATADATNRLAHMTGSDTDIAIKDGLSDREEAISKDFLGEDSKATFTKDDTGQLSDVSGEMKDMLNTGASAGDAFDSFSEALGGGSEYSWFSSTTQQNLNGPSTYSRDDYNYDYYYSNQEEVRRRLGLDG